MTSLIKTLSSYIPTLITNRLVVDPNPITEPVAEQLTTAVLFADISGFTALTEQLAKRGRSGAEDMAHLINTYLEQLINLVTNHGGDIVKFAGDGLIILWPISASDNKPNLETQLKQATLRVAQCSLAIQNKLHAYPVTEDITLSVKLAIGVGQVQTLHLGGMYGRWELLLAGSPLVQVGLAEGQAEPGQVILSPQAWNLIKEMCSGQPLEADCVRLEQIQSPIEPQPLIQPNLSPQVEEALRAYIPGAILNRLTVGQSHWLTELRRVSIIFLNLPDLNEKTPLNQAQEIMVNLQKSLYHYEGSLNKISVDDKGASLVAVLGLPPLAHEDDPLRAVKAAMQMAEALEAMGLRGAIGVTTGQVFCGVVGSQQRREYTIMGDVVNLSARLMQTSGKMQKNKDKKTKGHIPILCDHVTYQAAQPQIAFKSFPPVQLKGKSKPVPIYQPQHTNNQIKTSQSKIKMVGRETERKILAENLLALQQGTSSVIIIEGEAGIGKSRLVQSFLEQTEALDVAVLIGAADAIEKSTPYYAWRDVFKQIFQLNTVPSANYQQHLLTHLEAHSDLLQLAPLLNSILPLNLPDNHLTTQMSGEGKANNTLDLLVKLLQNFVSQSNTVLIIEDAHWLDSASWALLRQVSRQVEPLLLLIATRPIATPLPREYNQLLNNVDTRHLTLQTLPPKEVLSLVCYRLNVKSLPEPVADLLQEKAEGHPFFSEELAYALRDAGLIEVSNGVCKIPPDVGNFKSLQFPDTIQGIIISRIDRLSPQQQLTLKVASVIGQVFDYRTLHDIHPIETDKDNLVDYLQNLKTLEITDLESPSPQLAYIFKHIITQEVAYNLMSFAQRRELHKAMAEWLEQTYATDLSQHYSLLAQHWLKASNKQDTESLTKPIHYLTKAGERAIQDGVYQEAIDFLNQVMQLSQSKIKNQKSKIEMTHIHSLLGVAYNGLGQTAKSANHFEKAFALLGCPIPTTTVGLINGTIKNLLTFVYHSILPSKATVQKSQNHPYFLEITKIFDHLIKVYAFLNQSFSFFYLNTFKLVFYARYLSDKKTPSAELAKSYSDRYALCRILQLHKLADRYYHQARDIANKQNDLSTRAIILMITSVQEFGYKPWPKIQHDLKASSELYKQLGSKREWGDSLVLLGISFFYQAKFYKVINIAKKLYKLGLECDNLEHQAMGLSIQASCFLIMGRTEQAISLLKTASSLFNQIAESSAGKIMHLSILASAHLQQNNKQAAQLVAETANNLLKKSVPFTFAAGEGYTKVAEVYLTLWEDTILNGTQNQAKPLKWTARKACKILHRFASKHPTGHPQAQLYQGWFEWLSNRPNLAQQYWAKSVEYAKQLDMPYQQGLTHYHIGRLLTANTTQGQTHLKQALIIFEQIEAVYYLEQTKQLLSTV